MPETDTPTTEQFQAHVERFTSVAEQVLAIAKRHGATDSAVSLGLSEGLSTTVRKQEIDTVEFTQTQSLALTVYMGQAKGTASTVNMSTAALEKAVAVACDIAKYTSEDPFSGLGEASDMATDCPDLDLLHPWPLSPEQAIDIARECEQAAFDESELIGNSEGATVAAQNTAHVYGNTKGFVGGYASSRHSLSCAVVAGEGGQMQRGSWYSRSRLAENLQSAASIGTKAANRAVQRLHPQKLSTRTVPVVLDAPIATTLINHLFSAIGGRSVYKKSTFLADHIGKVIFPSSVTIKAAPRLPQALSSAPFDGDGLATRDCTFVESGTLQRYLLDVYSARQLSMQPEGNAGGARNIWVSDDAMSQTQLLNKMDTGLLVTGLMGQGVNLVTGDYSRGATGFWVEGGVIQYPVQEITISGRLQEMFEHIVAISDDHETRGNTRVGSVLLEQLTVSGA